MERSRVVPNLKKISPHTRTSRMEGGLNSWSIINDRNYQGLVGFSERRGGFSVYFSSISVYPYVEFRFGYCIESFQRKLGLA
jgi:hypothetical protein